MRRDEAAASVVVEVARAKGVGVLEIFQRSRGSEEAATARQLAMYLLHVWLGRRQEDVGRMLGRDRTTVGHACRTVEDGRDDRTFDAEVAAMESALSGLPELRHAA
ncbi:MAG: helix-turn-helix domain-containing protein [Devosia sp.]